MTGIVSTARLALPSLGFGAASVGNLFRRTGEAEARATLNAAIDAGITYVDTAPHYGRGLSERRVGDVVRGRPDILLSTKVGRLMQPEATIVDDRERDGFFSPMPFVPVYDYSRDGVLCSFEASLHRLGVAKVGLLLVHDIGPMIHGDRHAHYWHQLTDGGGFDALRELRDDGVIQGFGIGVNEVGVCIDAIRAAPLDVILLAGRYTLLEQEPLDVLFPACIAAGVQVIVGGPYNSGILAVGTRGGGHYDYGAAPEAIIARVRRMEAIADAFGVPLPAVALRFPLAHPAVSTVLPGPGDAQQVRETIAWFDHPIPADLWNTLKDANLIRLDAPVPQN